VTLRGSRDIRAELDDLDRELELLLTRLGEEGASPVPPPAPDAPLDEAGNAELRAAVVDARRRLADLRAELDELQEATGTLHAIVAEFALNQSGLAGFLEGLADAGPPPSPAPAARPEPDPPGRPGEPPETPADPPEGPEDTSGVGRRTVLSLATQFSTAAFTAVLTLFLVRALGPSDYGLFSLAISITGLLLLPTDLGISQSVGRFIAEQRHSRGGVAALVADALMLKVPLAAVFGLGLVVLAGPISSWYDEPGLAWPLRFAALSLMAQSLMMLFSSAFVSLGHTGRNLRVIFGESAMEVTASIALVLLGAGAAGAAAGRAVGYGFGALLGAILIVRLVGRRSVAVDPRRRANTRRIAGYAWPMFVVNGAFSLFSQIDLLLIGALMSSTAVGLFAAALRLTSLLHYPGLAISNSVSPRVVRTARHEPDRRSFQVALRWLIVLQVAIVVPLLVWATPIVNLLLGSEYEESALVLQVLAPFIFLQGIGPLVSVSVNYLGEARRRIPIAVAAVVVNCAIDLALIPRIGIVAGAIGTSAAYAIYVPAHYLICRRALDLPLRPTLVTLGRSALAGAAMALPLLALGTSTLAPLEWVAGAVLAPTAFVLVLLLTREVTLAQLRSLAHRLSRR
jgi:O-antigen/teichoic acid export membrane protein